MYQDLKMFQTASQMARHAGARQAMTAQNVANADTPGYQAKHLQSFADTVRQADTPTMQQTRKGHISSTTETRSRVANALHSEPAPNGNAVSLEQEMLNGAEIAREHSRAMAVYRHTMTVLRTTLGR